MFDRDPAPLAGLSGLSTRLLLAGLSSTSATAEERGRLFRTATRWSDLDAAVTAAYDIWSGDWLAFTEESVEGGALLPPHVQYVVGVGAIKLFIIRFICNICGLQEGCIFCFPPTLVPAKVADLFFGTI